MDHATLSALATGAIFFALGVLIDRLFQRRLRQTLAARDKANAAMSERLIAHKRTIGIANAEIVRLTPLAEIGRKRAASIAKDADRKRAKRAAKAGNVTPITSPPGKIIAA